MKYITKEAAKLVILIGLLGLLSLLPNTQSITLNNVTLNYQPKVNVPPSISGVSHTPTDPDSIQTIYISATITDIDGLSSTILYYRLVGAGVFNSTNLIQEGSTDVYGTSIGPYDADLTIEYYIYAADASTSHLASTNDNGGAYYSFSVIQADYDAPVISNVYHAPEIPTDNDLISIYCTVEDISDVIVLLNFRVNGSEWANQTMINIGDDTYLTNVGEFNIDTLFEYRIYAIDQSRNNNTALENADGENYYFTVVFNDTVGPIISDIYVDPGIIREGQMVTITCSVTDDHNDIESVILYYRVNLGDWMQVYFVLNGDYSVTIGPFILNDFVEYYIVAFDDSLHHNMGINDNGADLYDFIVYENTENANFYVLIPIVAIFALSIIYNRKK